MMLRMAPQLISSAELCCSWDSLRINLATQITRESMFKWKDTVFADKTVFKELIKTSILKIPSTEVSYFSEFTTVNNNNWWLGMPPSTWGSLLKNINSFDLHSNLITQVRLAWHFQHRGSCQQCWGMQAMFEITGNTTWEPGRVSLQFSKCYT